MSKFPAELETISRHLGSDRGYLALSEQEFAMAALSRLLVSAPGWPRTTCLVGPSGSGKSTLCRELLRRWREQHGAAAAMVVSIAELQQQLREELADRGALTERFANLGLLVCEDLDRAGDWENCPTLRWGFWDALDAAGTTVVWTSRRLPGTIADLPGRLVNRCHAGLCLCLPSPTSVGRRRLLEHWSQQLPVEPASEILDELARTTAGSWGELSGRWWQLAQHLGTDALAWRLDQVRALQRQDRPLKFPTFLEITRSVAEQFSVNADDLVSRSRSHELLIPRHCAMYLCREVTQAPLVDIGKFFDGRDHSTISHGCARIEDALTKESSLRRVIEAIVQQWQASHAKPA